MKNFFKEFKEFISRGNIVDLSVAVIIGGAFSAIVTALTSQIIMPLVNWVLALCGGKEGLESAYTFLSRVETDGELDLTKSIYINWGAFISAILNFLIIAFTLFLIVRLINRSRKRVNALHSAVKKQANKEELNRKKAARARAKEKGISYKAAKAEIKAEEEAAKAKEEADKAKAEEEAINAEKEADSKLTEQELLLEIRNLLKNK